MINSKLYKPKWIIKQGVIYGQKLSIFYEN